jgi:hypothetical protein
MVMYIFLKLKVYILLDDFICIFLSLFPKNTDEVLIYPSGLHFFPTIQK